MPGVMRIDNSKAGKLGTTANYRWVIFGLLSMTHFFMAMCHFSWGPLGPILKAEFNINNSQLGFIISLMYFSMVVVSIPSGMLIDKYGVKWFLLVSSLMVGTGIFILPLSAAYIYTASAAVMIGVGYGMINQITTKGIMSWFEPLERGTIMGIKQMGVTIGGSLVGIYIPFMGQIIGWDKALFLLSGIIIVIAFSSIYLYREKQEHDPETDLPQPQEQETTTPHETLKEILLDRKLIIVTALSAFLAFCQASTISFIVVYAREAFAFTPVLAGGLLTAAMTGGTISRIVFGMLSDRTFKGDRIFPLALISLIGSIASLSLAFCGVGTHIVVVYAVAAALGVSFMGWNSLGMVLLAEMVGSKHVGSVLGVVFTIAWGAMVLGPSTFGYMVDHSGYSTGWWMLAALSLLAFCGFIYLSKQRVEPLSPR